LPEQDKSLPAILLYLMKMLIWLLLNL